MKKELSKSFGNHQEPEYEIGIATSVTLVIEYLMKSFQYMDTFFKKSGIYYADKFANLGKW